ncbi:MAG: hypothetical protein R2822_14980 [Spirosomataceae bacterium]
MFKILPKTVTVAKEIELKERYRSNMGAQLVKEGFKTADAADIYVQPLLILA